MRARRLKARRDRDLCAGPARSVPGVRHHGRRSTGRISHAVRCGSSTTVSRRRQSPVVTTRVGLAKGRGDESPWRFLVPDDPEYQPRPPLDRRVASEHEANRDSRPGTLRRSEAWPERPGAEGARSGVVASVDEQFDILGSGAVDLISEAELRRSSSRAVRSAPSSVSTHRGPTSTSVIAVVLRTLRQFQERGHTAVLIVGDFTAQIGDPSGRSSTRPRALEGGGRRERRHLRRAGSSRVLLPENLEIRRNSEWLGTMDIDDVLRLTSLARRSPGCSSATTSPSVTPTASRSR